MTDVVTRLVVRGDGSLSVLDQFENKMEAAGKATDRATGAVANYEARMARARAAMEAGNAISTQTVARRSAEQRAFDGLASSVDRSYGLRIRLEREAERAAVSAANAVNMGYITQEQALTTLVALESRHAAQMNQIAGANDNLAHSYRNTATAADEAAGATMRLNAATSRRGGGANQAHTTNLLFQAQDIAMMSAMGQAPMMLAMQQGMQVGGIFHQMGSGRAIAQGLGGAIVGLLNPINLVTIAAIGLGAAGIQAFMGMMNSSEEAANALEDHKAWLDKLLVGYEAAGAAADSAFAATSRSPEGVVSSDLRASLREQEEAAAGLQKRIEASRDALREQVDYFRQLQDIGTSTGGDGDALEGPIRQIELMRQLAIDTSSSKQALEDAATAARELYNTADDPSIKTMADQAYQLAVELMGVRAQASSAQAALAALNNMDIQISIQTSTDEAISAIERITRLAPELRSAKQQADDALNEALGSAPDAILRQAAQDQYSQTIAALDEQERRRAADKAGKAGGKTVDQWSGNVDSFRQRIASQQMEIDLMGKSTYEVERQKAAFDLLNQAKAAGIPITAKVTDEINLMSAQYAAATVELENAAKAQAAMEEQMNFYRSTFTGFFGDLKAGLMEGKSFWESLGNAGANALDKIADRALSMAADGLFDMIFGSIMGGITGGMGGSFGGNSLGGGLASIFRADGGPVVAGQPYIVGERRPEVFVPNQSGTIVPSVGAYNAGRAANGNASMGDLIINNVINVPAGTTADVAPAIAREVAKELRKQIPDAIQSYNRNPLRRAS